MRLGTIEREILRQLLLWSTINPQWEWNPSGFCESLITDGFSDGWFIGNFRSGKIVRGAKLLNEMQCHRAAFSRAVSTLRKKGFIFALTRSNLDVERIAPRRDPVRFVGLTDEGKHMADTLTNAEQNC